MAILLTDHNVRETLAVTDRSYIIHHGRIVRDGLPSALVDDPLGLDPGCEGFMGGHVERLDPPDRFLIESELLFQDSDEFGGHTSLFSKVVFFLSQNTLLVFLEEGEIAQAIVVFLS
jgi:hypothetical protein